MSGLRAVASRAANVAIPPVVVSVLVAILGAAFLLRTDFYNPLDEYTHYDYVVRIAKDAEIPRINDTVGQEALKAWACSGQMAEGLRCGAEVFDPTLAPWSGHSPATSYPLPYYLMTALTTRVVHTVLWNLSWFDAARVASLAWLLALAALATVVGRRLGGPTPAVMAGALLLGSMPLVLSQGASVNNDVAAASLTLLTLWAWIRLRSARSSIRWGCALALATVAMLVKQHAVLALMLVAALELRERLLLRRSAEVPTSDTESSRTGSREVLTAWLTVLGGALVSLFAYVLISRVLEPAIRGTSTVSSNMAAFLASVEPQAVGLAAAKFYAGLQTVFQAAPFVPAVSGPWAQLIPTFVAAAAVGGLVFAVLRTQSPVRESVVGVVRQVTLVYVALFPVAFLAYLKLTGAPYYSNPRYHLIGMSLALILLMTGARRWWGWASLFGALCVWAFMLREILTWAG